MAKLSDSEKQRRAEQRRREAQAEREALERKREAALRAATPDQQAGLRWAWRKYGHYDEGTQKLMAQAFAAGRRSERIEQGRERAEAERERREREWRWR